MTPIKHLNHVALVVDDMNTALEFWRDILGLEVDRVEDVPEQESRVAFLPVGQSEIEIVKPTTDDSGLARYLNKRGPGIHHVCFTVDDIAATLQRLKSRGVRLINETPQLIGGVKKVGFIHPESTHGVLVELVEFVDK
jgi:methylmalonyl-CoA/ethylmalonyl-CoA epimerase